MIEKSPETKENHEENKLKEKEQPEIHIDEKFEEISQEIS